MSWMGQSLRARMSISPTWQRRCQGCQLVFGGDDKQMSSDGGIRGHFMRAGDGAIAAPRTGQIAPLDKDRRKWLCTCYHCCHPDGGESVYPDLARKIAILKHLDHIKEHPECS